MSVNSKMTALADEIRELSGTTAKIGLDGMTTHVANANTEIDDQAALLQQAIAALEGKAAGGAPAPVLQEKSVSPTTTSQTVIPDSGYDALSKVTVAAMPTATQATPSITVSSAGKITATSTQTTGYVAAGTKTATKQLTTQAAQTITPGTSNKTIASGRYLTGTQTIKGDANLKAENITEGISIFGVAGSNPYAKTATDTEVNSQATKLAELKTILAGKAAGGSGGATIDTCSVDLTVNGGSFSVSYTTLDEDGNIIHRAENVSTQYKTITCVCYTIIAVTRYNNAIINSAHTLTKAELLVSLSDYASIIGLTAAAGETAQCILRFATTSGGSAD